MDIKVADEVWIGTALLHYEKPSAKSFSNNQIIDRIKRENIFGAIRPGIQTHITSHCLANKPAQPNRCRMLYSLPNGTKRLFRDKDNFDASRVNGQTKPNEEDVPEKYRYLLNWYNREYNHIDLREFTNLKHNERCPECKDNIKAILQKIYGKVEQNCKFHVGTLPSDYEENKYFEPLRKIYEALQEQRGFKNFVKVKTLPRCDFFIPNPGFVFEFDESQHFTSARKLALELYPEELQLGFDRKKWIDRCCEINSKDNDPPYRDEQRAWYDTLRDFLPEIIGLKPTARLFAKEYVWCNLNANNKEDLERFQSLMSLNDNRKIAVKADSNPEVARIILTREWQGNLDKARQILDGISIKWPKGKRVKFIITPGGFLQFDWPCALGRNEIGDNKSPNSGAVNYIVEEAKKCVNYTLDDGIREKLLQLADYITFGVDSRKNKVSTTHNYIGQLHAELVILVDLRNKCVYWSGKSYPTTSQENGLVRIMDLATHFFDLDVGRTMVLGCHDLTVFNPRSKNAIGWRKKVNEEFLKMAKDQRPLYVLHHPHTTVKRRTWWNAWQHLQKILPSVRQYAGAGCYFEADRRRSWDPIKEVLSATKKGETIDFIV